MATTYKITFPTDSLNNFRKMLNGVINDQKTLDKVSEVTTKSLQNQGSVGSNVLLNFSKKIEGLGETLKKFTGNEDFVKPFQAMALQMNMARSQGQGMFSSLLQGVMGFGTVGKATFGSLGKMALIFGSTLMAALGPIALIAAGIFLLKKAWDNNLGGIQTKWAQVMGQIRDVWAKIDIAINKFFQDISPFVESFLDNFIAGLKVAFTIGQGLFKGILAVVKPIFNAFMEIGKILMDAFGGNNKQNMEGVMNFGKTLGQIFTVVGKVLGFVLNVLLKPIIFNIKVLIKIFQLLGKIVIPIFQTIWNIIKPIIEGIEKLISLGQKFGLFEELAGKEEIKPQASGATVSRTTNVANTVNISPTGNIDGNSAPRLGTVLNSQLSQGVRQ